MLALKEDWILVFAVKLHYNGIEINFRRHL